MRKADYDVLCPALMHLKEAAVIDYASYNLVHIVRLVRIVRNDLVENVCNSSRRIGSLHKRSLLPVV